MNVAGDKLAHSTIVRTDAPAPNSKSKNEIRSDWRLCREPDPVACKSLQNPVKTAILTLAKHSHGRVNRGRLAKIPTSCLPDRTP